MGSKLVFDDIAKNLLVFLKGQVISLSNKATKEEALRQVQSITFTLRSSIAQLENASASDPRAGSNGEEIVAEIDNLRKANTKLQADLFTEKSNSEGLRQQLLTLNTVISQNNSERSSTDYNMKRLQEENSVLQRQLEEAKMAGDDSSLNKLRGEIAELESSLSTLKEDNIKLKQAVQNKEIELAKSKDALMEAVNIDSSEVEALKQQISSIEAIKAENANLKTEVSKLNIKLAEQPNSELLKNNISSLETKVKDLEDSVNQKQNKIEETQNKLIEIQERLQQSQEKFIALQTEAQRAQNTPDPSLVAEKEALEQKINELQVLFEQRESEFETTIKKHEEEHEAALKQKETEYQTALSQKESEFAQLSERASDLEAVASLNVNNTNVALTPRQCIQLFQTLSSTVRRLENSIADKDVYKMAKDAVSILQDSNAISKIPSTGTIYDSKMHKAVKAFKGDFLPDETIIFEEVPGYTSGYELVQRSTVWISKSAFTCTECGKLCRPHEFFCPQCGCELSAPDGTSKRQLPPYPTSLEVNLPLLDELLRQKNVRAIVQLLNVLQREHPNNPEVLKRKSEFERMGA